MFEKIKAWLKELSFQFTHDPNSPEGLRHRADKLHRDEGLSYQHPYVSALLKQADLIEEEKRKKCGGN